MVLWGLRSNANGFSLIVGSSQIKMTFLTLKASFISLNNILQTIHSLFVGVALGASTLSTPNFFFQTKRYYLPLLVNQFLIYFTRKENIIYHY